MPPEENIAALEIIGFPIDDNCVGSKWKVENEDQLVRLIAIVVMGQAAQAAYIIDELIPASPAFTLDTLKQEAVIKFTVQDVARNPRTGYPRIQRDGLIFEIISWIAAKQVSGDKCFLKDPHTSSTSQGLDGIMIELNEDGSEILKSTIFEDKCTDNPRDTFTQKVIPGFLDRHENTRNAELIAAAATLIQLSGVSNVQAMSMVRKVIDNSSRQYRAGFALSQDFDTEEAQKALFKGYEKIKDISQEQRIGASLIVDGNLRDWFDALATKIIVYIEQLDVEQN
ncbi:hypothetical protein LAD80_000130 [Proteus mirabilis]|uniref:Uncharacterized protein n=1 Tax=Providencia alcalifaciens 205/92 TaxID=1256988 RepID=A0AAV3M6Z3_9GAMM|nr:MULTISPECIES: hypothetical protein [Morganellaceae]EKV1609151.1 hypothetical protein [Proteus mirabilis]EUD11315.1 hypothetical protein HMPREF1563_1727 [Providencia alcalifaciens 205/92]MBQ0616995.1 hypothetical protein [Proteus mirabilis]MCJ2217997.1 hypothetical protein [Proteus mirabilis]MDK6973339.1 hypothetical protein [Proteus mirabilis]